MTDILIPANISGYAVTDDYMAQRSVQGGRVHYTIILPLHQVHVTLPVPDPKEPFEDNRQVRSLHAEAFADYVRKNRSWHAGALTVRGLSSALKFDEFPNQSDGPVKLGLLRVPRNMRNAFRIIDGQHRILGVKMLFERISEETVHNASRLAKARRSASDSAAAAKYERELEELDLLKDRLKDDTITVDLVVEDDETAHRQIFVDVANNALSVQKAVTARFDTKKVVNRAVVVLLDETWTDELVRSRIDEQTDRVVGANPNLIGSGTLADIVRIVKKGVSGRISAADERVLDGYALAREANRFFAVLRESFSVLGEIAAGSVPPSAVRGKHLISSSTMLRIMAGVYHELVMNEVSRDRIVAFFKAIDRAGATPLSLSSPYGRLWISSSSGAFVEGESAPGSRSQQVKGVVEQVAEWFKNPPAELRWS